MCLLDALTPHKKNLCVLDLHAPLRDESALQRTTIAGLEFIKLILLKFILWKF